MLGTLKIPNFTKFGIAMTTVLRAKTSFKTKQILILYMVNNLIDCILIAPLNTTL